MADEITVEVDIERFCHSYSPWLLLARPRRRQSDLDPERIQNRQRLSDLAGFLAVFEIDDESYPGDTVLAFLQDAGAIDAGDYFSFRVNEATMDLDGAPYGGARYPVEAIMGGRTFVKFHLDVGIGDIIVDPVETAQTRDWLGFAGIESPTVPMIQREQPFAEKIHAYTLPRQGAPNSRVRDLVDLALLVRSGTLDAARVIESLQRTFARRNTHPLPTSLDGPPDNWALPFVAMAEECSLKIVASAAFAEVAAYFENLGLSD